MTKQLKPCPFCGREPTVQSKTLDERFAYAKEITVKCCVSVTFTGDASRGGYADNSKVKTQAINTWNNRPYENKIRAQAVRDALAYARTECDWTENTFYKTVAFARACEDYANKIESQAAKGGVMDIEDRMNRVVDIENVLMNMYAGKTPLPTNRDCLIMALRLGTPKEQWTDAVKNHVWGEKLK